MVSLRVRMSSIFSHLSRRQSHLRASRPLAPVLSAFCFQVSGARVAADPTRPGPARIRTRTLAPRSELHHRARGTLKRVCVVNASLRASPGRSVTAHVTPLACLDSLLLNSRVFSRISNPPCTTPSAVPGHNQTVAIIAKRSSWPLNTYMRVVWR